RTGIRFRLRYFAVGRADHVIVPTAAVARDAVERLDIPEDRITVIAEAPALAFTPRDPEEVAAVRARYGVPEEYLIWVGGLRHPDPRKRVAELVAAPRTLPLVI